jgi:hypothetical protein
MATKKKPQASPKVSFSPGAEVVGQVTRATSDPASLDVQRSAPIQLASMAPASSFRSSDEVAASSSSSDGPMTRSIVPPDGPPSSPPAKNDKAFSRLERGPTATRQRRRPIEGRAHPSPAASIPSASSPAAAAAADALCATVEGLIGAAESRGTSARESSLANGTAPSPDGGSGGGGGGGGGEGGGRAFEVAALHGGPFAAHELGRLSLHCAPAATAIGVDGGGSVVVGSSKTGAWSSLDGDALSTLTAMLRSHVTSALGVDLVGEGRDVVARCAEAHGDVAADNGGRRGMRPAITIHQVSRTPGPDHSSFVFVDSSPMTSFLLPRRIILP